MKLDGEATLEKPHFCILYRYWGYHEILQQHLLGPFLALYCKFSDDTPCNKVEIMTTRAVFEDVVIQTNLWILHISFMFVNHCGKVHSGGESLAILLNGK